MLSDVLACALWETETASKTAHYNKNKKQNSVMFNGSKLN